MSHALFNLNPDLKRLRDEGYFVQILGGLLVMRDVPYADSARQVRKGTLISSLNLSGDVTQKPETHQVWFDGDSPCRADGTTIASIVNSSGVFDLGRGLKAKHHFSSKPDGGYSDYHHKMTTYALVISGPAAELQPGASPRVYRDPEEDEETVFNYVDTATDRAGLGALAERLAADTVSIIGVGGTGSYVLDLVAKTRVREIRLFDSDEFLQHNAFRSPGAPSLAQLREVPRKVRYLSDIYSRMRRGIVAHETALDASNLHLLEGSSFAFVCIDDGPAKRLIGEKLESLAVTFIDVGMGLELSEGSLGGILRMTASTPENRDLARGHICFDKGGPDDVYASNIQVADLNALNAVLAVIKWKKLRGFFHDLEKERRCSYTIDGNQLENGDAG